MGHSVFSVSKKRISLNDVFSIFQDDLKLSLSTGVEKEIKKVREKLMEKIKHGKIIYGVNTGFGELKNKIIPDKDLEELQENLIKSHAIGVGKPSPLEVVKLTILFRIISLSKGYSGVRKELIEKLIEVFNKNIHVYIPLEGSVGASGDLAPLAHLGLFLIGKGKIVKNNKIVDFDYKEFKPIKLKEKEGLALINGTSFSLALLTYSYFNFLKILENLFYALGLSFCALNGNVRALSSFIHQAKEHKGQKDVSKILRELLKNSDFVINSESGKHQDSYSLRCIPQIVGPVIDTLRFVSKIIENEINSSSDNPIFDEKGNPYSGGNFHAMYLAMASDYLKISAAILSNLIERLLFKLLDPNLNKELPPFLTKNPGINSGLMILQYTVASLTAEIRTLSTPSSIHNLPTSANQEDVVSMSIPSLITLTEIIEKLKIIVTSLIFSTIVAIEIRKEKNNSLRKIGSHQLEEFYEKCKRHINMEIKERDVAYFEDLNSLKESIFSDIWKIEEKIWKLFKV